MHDELLELFTKGVRTPLSEVKASGLQVNSSFKITAINRGRFYNPHFISKLARA